MPTTSLSSHRAPPRHADIAGRLQQAIAKGQYVVGSLLPTELDLADSYGVSRQTVRAALRALQDRGFISRKKGVGSRVESSMPGSGYTQAIASLDDLVRVAAVEIRQLVDEEPVTLNRSVARRLGAPVGSRWIRFGGLRVEAMRTDRPLSWADIYLDARFARIAPTIRAQPDVLVATLLERECGQSIEDVHQQVSATVLDERLARALAVPAGSAGLRVLRHYKTAEKAILEITETIYRADRMSLSMHLRRTKPGAGAA